MSESMLTVETAKQFLPEIEQVGISIQRLIELQPVLAEKGLNTRFSPDLQVRLSFLFDDSDIFGEVREAMGGKVVFMGKDLSLDLWRGAAARFLEAQSAPEKQIKVAGAIADGFDEFRYKYERFLMKKEDQWGKLMDQLINRQRLRESLGEFALLREFSTWVKNKNEEPAVTFVANQGLMVMYKAAKNLYWWKELGNWEEKAINDPVVEAFSLDTRYKLEELIERQITTRSRSPFTRIIGQVMGTRRGTLLNPGMHNEDASKVWPVIEGFIRNFEK